ncbi:MAG TPA: hypothetical protein VJ694_01280 [Patescibacteria group bacterium]|nr:hypothetical protein [Patescibacteria group bacterium]
MGNIKVLVRDPESVNFDKICRLTLEIRRGDNRTFDVIEVVSDGAHDMDIEGDECDREYWKTGRRSMTESYAIRTHLDENLEATAVVALCQALAENHGKVPGVKGGSLYKKGMIPSYAKGLTLLPDRASEIVTKLVKAVLASLKDPHPILALQAAAGTEWDEIDSALASAERAVYEKARDVARALNEGRYADGKTFPLAKASGAYAPQGIAIATRNPNLMKHLWAALKAMEPHFRVATAVVSHPDTKRIAVLCSTQCPVDVGPVAKALKTRFPETEFDVNLERSSIVWDPRSKTPGPTAEQVAEIVSAQLAFRKEERAVQGPRFGATLGDRFVQKRR